MHSPKMSFSAVGDFLIQRVIDTKYEGFEALRDQISKADARFFNLETTLHDGEYFGNQFYGGSYLHAPPAVLDVAKAYGFNMVSFANNHTMDFSYGGMLATLDLVRANGFVNAGVGRNLDEAAAPAYLETAKGRVALISVVSTMMNPAAMAGRQSRRIQGRPGVNGLRVDEKVEVTPEQFAVIQEIAQKSCINAREDASRAMGYWPALPEGVSVLKDLRFVCGTETRYRTRPKEEDMARVEKAIYEAQAQADYIIISVHSHEQANLVRETPADFLVEFSHRCIDFGAHAVIGHGPHLLRPVEIYKNRPIFYSLGNFILHNESIRTAPEDMFEKYNMTSDNTLREMFCKRSNNYTRGLLADRCMMEAVVPYFEMENGELTHLELLPIELGFEEPRWRNGNPRPATDRGIIERLAQMSEAYGTKIRVDERGMGIVSLQQD